LINATNASKKAHVFQTQLLAVARKTGFGQTIQGLIERKHLQQCHRFLILLIALDVLQHNLRFAILGNDLGFRSNPEHPGNRRT